MTKHLGENMANLAAMVLAVHVFLIKVVVLIWLRRRGGQKLLDPCDQLALGQVRDRRHLA